MGGNFSIGAIIKPKIGKSPVSATQCQKRQWLCGNLFRLPFYTHLFLRFAKKLGKLWAFEKFRTRDKLLDPPTWDLIAKGSNDSILQYPRWIAWHCAHTFVQ